MKGEEDDKEQENNYIKNRDGTRLLSVSRKKWFASVALGSLGLRSNR